MMKKKFLISISTILVIVILAFSYIFIHARKLQRDTCLSVIELVLVHLFKQKELKEKVNLTNEWRRLTLNEQQYLLMQVPENNRTECTGFVSFNVEQNSSKNNLDIFVRQLTPKDDVEVMIER